MGKTIREVKTRLDEIKTEMDELIDEASKGKRELTADENAELELLQEEKEKLIDEATELIDKIEEAEEEVKTDSEPDESGDEQKQENKRNKLDFNKLKSVRMVEKREKLSLSVMIRKMFMKETFNDAEKELISRGQRELVQSGIGNFGDIVIPSQRSAYQATVSGQGAEDVATELQDIITPVWANQVLAKAGALYLTGNVGNIQYPLLGQQNAGWNSETATAMDGAGSFKAVTLTPKRLTAYVDISKQMIIQDNTGNLESIVNNEIVKAVANVLEKTLLGNAPGSSTQPAGLFNTFAPSVITPTWQEIVNLEAQLEAVDVLGNKKVVLNPTIKGALKSTAKDTGSGLFLMTDDGLLNGYETLTTSNSDGLVMGDFSRYVVANWGGTDITVDPYSQSINGVVRIVVNTFWDASALYDSSLVGQPIPFVTAKI
jgi:HK97 family phage major capsid protein